MNIYIYVCMYECKNVRMSEYMYICVYVCMYAADVGTYFLEPMRPARQVDGHGTSEFMVSANKKSV